MDFVRIFYEEIDNHWNTLEPVTHFYLSWLVGMDLTDKVMTNNFTDSYSIVYILKLLKFVYILMHMSGYEMHNVLLYNIVSCDILHTSKLIFTLFGDKTLLLAVLSDY